MAIGYKCNSQKVVGFIDTEWGGSTDPYDLYLSRSTDKYSNMYILSIVSPCMLSRDFSSCKKIFQHNNIMIY